MVPGCITVDYGHNVVGTSVTGSWKMISIYRTICQVYLHMAYKSHNLTTTPGDCVIRPKSNYKHTTSTQSRYFILYFTVKTNVYQNLIKLVFSLI